MAAEKKTTEAVEEIDYEQLVDFYEPATKENKSDIFVSLNGRNMKIQRGKRVKIPLWAYEILMNQRDMDDVAIERSIELQKDAEF